MTINLNHGRDGGASPLPPRSGGEGSGVGALFEALASSSWITALTPSIFFNTSLFQNRSTRMPVADSASLRF